MITINITPATAPNYLVHYCVSLLERMYLRWADRHNYKWSLEAKLPERRGAGPQNMPSAPNDDGAGGLLWSIIHIDAPDGSLDDEHGVHMLNLVSPYDAGARRYTTFVYVEIEGLGEVNIAGMEMATRSYNFIRGTVTDHVHHNTVDLMTVLGGDFSALKEEDSE